MIGNCWVQTSWQANAWVAGSWASDIIASIKAFMTPMRQIWW